MPIPDTSTTYVWNKQSGKKYLLPPEQHAAYREIGFKNLLFHPCGEQNINLPFWAEVDMGGPGIISVGHEINLAKVAQLFPKDIALGNLEPLILQTFSPQEVYKAARDLIVEHKDIPGGYIFSLGCEMPPTAPAGCTPHAQ